VRRSRDTPRSGTGGLDFAYRRNAGAEPTLRMSFLNTIDAGLPKYHSVAMPISVLQERYGSARVSRCAGDRAGGVIWWREAQSTDTYDERDGTWTRPVVNDHHPPQNLLRRFAAISFWHRTAGSAAFASRPVPWEPSGAGTKSGTQGCRRDHSTLRALSLGRDARKMRPVARPQSMNYASSPWTQTVARPPKSARCR
jgi:hypothetical protein